MDLLAKHNSAQRPRRNNAKIKAQTARLKVEKADAEQHDDLTPEQRAKRDKKRESVRKAMKLRYDTDPAFAKDKARLAKERTKRILEWYYELKATLACTRCPENHPSCLDFHHRPGETKEMLISWAVRRGVGKDRIMAEIAKCDVVCSNCHRKEHWEERFSARTEEEPCDGPHC